MPSRYPAPVRQPPNSVVAGAVVAARVGFAAVLVMLSRPNIANIPSMRTSANDPAGVAGLFLCYRPIGRPMEVWIVLTGHRAVSLDCPSCPNLRICDASRREPQPFPTRSKRF